MKKLLLLCLAAAAFAAPVQKYESFESEVYAAYYIGRNRGGADSDGTLTLNLAQAKGEFRARWFDPRKGTFADETRISGAAARTLRAPSPADDWALLVRRAAPSNRDDRKLDVAFEMLRQAVSAGLVPGAVALVAENGKIVREAAYGLSDVEKRVPFRTNTICWLASITKPVTAAAVMALVEEGKLRLDDPIERYLPEFKSQNAPDGRHHAITIRQVLTHSAGFPSNPPDRDEVFTPYWTSRTIAATVPPIAKAPLDFVPGAEVRYSNAGYFVLGRIIELASGIPYEKYVKSRLLDRLGMKDTHFISGLPASEQGRTAAVYRRTDGRRTLYYRFDPALERINPMADGGLFSTARDTLKFYQAFLGGGGALTARSVQEMTREQAPGRGLGWSVRHDGFSHGGSSGAFAWGDPERKLVGVLLLQHNDFDRVSRLRSTFVHAVREAYGDRTLSPGLEKPVGRPWIVRLGGSSEARVEASAESPSGRTSTLTAVWTGGQWTIAVPLDEAGLWRVRTRSDPPDPAVDSNFAVEARPPIAPKK